MNRASEIVTAGQATIETYVDGDEGGPGIVALPSYGRDGGADFDRFTAALAGAGYRVLRPQPRGIARSTGPMTGVTLQDLGDDVAHVISKLGNGRAAVLGHAFGNFVARAVAADHPSMVSTAVRLELSLPGTALPAWTTFLPDTAAQAAGPGGPGTLYDDAVEAGGALGEFLRARRRLLTVHEAGIPASGVPGQRRSPGLRREELAALAGVSLPYYTRLEQGQDRHPSAQVTDALGRALRLDDEAFAYLRRIAGHAPDQAPPGSAETVRPGLLGLLDRLDQLPSIVISPYRDVLAANHLAQALHVGYAPGQNLLRFLFLDPRARERVIDWDQVARGAVATLRADSGARPEDTRLRDLVTELSRHSQQFHDLWTRHDIGTFTTGRIRFSNPHVGPVTINYESLAVTTAPGQSLAIGYAAPGSPDEQALARLSTITARKTS